MRLLKYGKPSLLQGKGRNVSRRLMALLSGLDDNLINGILDRPNQLFASSLIKPYFKFVSLRAKLICEAYVQSRNLCEN